MGRRKLHRGYTLKRDFCTEYKISISEFNKVMQDKGHLVHTLISTDCFGGRKKYALSIADNHVNGSYILPLHGSNNQGSYQYSIKFLLDVFGIKSLTKNDYSKYKLTFGKFKNLKLAEMVTTEQCNYLKWLHGEMVKGEDINSEKFRAINWYVSKINVE